MSDVRQKTGVVRRETPLRRRRILQLQTKHELFFEMYYAGRSKQAIATALGASIPLVSDAYPTVNFDVRGSIRPPWCSKENWKLRQGIKARNAEKLLKEAKKAHIKNTLKSVAEGVS